MTSEETASEKKSQKKSFFSLECIEITVMTIAFILCFFGGFTGLMTLGFTADWLLQHLPGSRSVVIGAGVNMVIGLTLFIVSLFVLISIRQD